MTVHINEACQKCRARQHCSDVLKGWKGHRTHRPDFIAGVARLVVLHSLDMACLMTGPEQPAEKQTIDDRYRIAKRPPGRGMP